MKNINEQQLSMEDEDLMSSAAGDQGFVDETEEILDMDEFEESGMLELVDPSVATTMNKVQIDDTKKNREENSSNNGTTNATSGSTIDGSGDSVLRTRTYDLHITYDKYYQTPRLWVIGYNEVY